MVCPAEPKLCNSLLPRWSVAMLTIRLLHAGAHFVISIFFYIFSAMFSFCISSLAICDRESQQTGDLFGNGLHIPNVLSGCERLCDSRVDRSSLSMSSLRTVHIYFGRRQHTTGSLGTPINILSKPRTKMNLMLDCKM